MVEKLDTLMDSILEEARKPKQPDYVPTERELCDHAARLADAGYYPYDRDAYREICYWVACRESGKMKRQRGLMLVGKAGCGKTMFFKCGVWSWPVVSAAHIVDCHKLCGGKFCDEFEYRAFRAWDSEQDRMPLCIDDLGQEPIAVSFGQREEVLDAVLCKRYRWWQEHGWPETCITSNLTIAELDKRYGRRVTDRLREMCKLVEFKVGSNRQSAKEA